MSYTCLDLIGASLKRIGVLQAGEPVSAEDAADGLLRLNDLVDSFAAERLVIYAVARTLWTIVSGTATYTVGTGGNVELVRPQYIDAIKFVDTTGSPDLEMELEGPLTEAAYRGISLKGLTATYPTAAYYEPTFPLGLITLYPAPTSTTLQGVLYAGQAVSEFASQFTAIALPPGYKLMLRENLAAALWPEWFAGQPLPPELRAEAIRTKQLIKTTNVRLADLSSDPGALIGWQGAGYSILSDQ